MDLKIKKIITDNTNQTQTLILDHPQLSAIQYTFNQNISEEDSLNNIKHFLLNYSKRNKLID
jgi:hypothetical protein